MKNKKEKTNFLNKVFKYRENKLTKELQTFSMLEVVILIIIVCVVSIISTTALTYQLFKGTKTSDKVTFADVEPIAETYNYILENYYGNIDKDTLISGAIRGMLDTIGDKNSSFIEEESSNTFNITLEGTYKGLGIEIYNKDNQVVILNVIADTPALRVGLKSGDIIKKLDQMELAGVSTSDFVSYVASKKTDDFTLIIERDGKESSYSISKDNIILKSVGSDLIKSNNKKIGYINVSVFAKNTYTQFKDYLNSLEEDKIDSLIIDLRGNTGGHLSVVTNMISLFLESDKVIYQTEDKTGVKKVYSTGRNNKKYSIVILTNEFSASASEIMTAALKENLNVYQIGTKTYGKGTVQELQTLSNNIQYKVTTKKWLTPNGTWINDVGIEPDLNVKLDDVYYENPSSENDNQLNSAIEYLKNK